MITRQLGYENIAHDVSMSVAPFEENPNLRLGDADSGHGVIFGTLEGIGEVAVKPHPKRQRALQESRNLEVANERGLNAVEPIVVAVGGVSNYLITRYRPGLSHLGQTDWAIEAGEPQIQSVLEPALDLAANVIAARHNVGIVNLDSQVRNIVSDQEGADVFVDAEKALVDQRPDVKTLHGNKDVVALGTSVLHRGLMSDSTPSYRVGFLRETVIEPYLEQVNPDLFVELPEVRSDVVQQRWNLFLQRSKK